jgi:predicted tellurium resistance membrane protein TerC
VISEAMEYKYVTLVGGALLFYVAIKLVTEDAEGEGDDVERAHTLWRAMIIVAVADIVMSLDNVLAIAGSAKTAAAQVDVAHAMAIKSTLIIFGLATSIPLIIAGSGILMLLLERYRVLVWGGGALLGWVAGELMAGDSALHDWFSEPVVHQLHIWGGPIGGIIVVGMGYILVGLHRRLILDEVLAGVALLIWIAVDRMNDSLFGGANPDLVKIWSVRGAVFAVMVVAYAIARNQWHIEQEEV